MARLTVWKFGSSAGAVRAAATLHRLACAGSITIDDAVAITWPEGRSTPLTRQLDDLATTDRGSTAGIDDHLVTMVRNRIRTGTSALFVLTSGEAVDGVWDAFAVDGLEPVHTGHRSEPGGRPADGLG